MIFVPSYSFFFFLILPCNAYKAGLTLRVLPAYLVHTGVLHLTGLPVGMPDQKDTRNLPAPFPVGTHILYSNAAMKCNPF